jgi:FtsP/CotA-like multicopper oxidase with cupredoxin domain
MNDVEFDAYLANDWTLDDPVGGRGERGGRVRLRIINAAASTNFMIDPGGLEAHVVATDGNPVHPMKVSGLLPIAMAQRLDVLVQVPAQEGAWPLLALREGKIQRTGLILATRHGAVGKVSPLGHHAAPPADTRLEHHLHPMRRLPEAQPARRVHLRLTGGMNPYRWGIGGRKWGEHVPIRLEQGERVELTFENDSDMAHPMHMHGHHFKVTAINGMLLDGPFRDTVLVPVEGKVKVAFDAGTPGRWLLHCHNAYHMAPGMMTEIII